MSAASQSPVAFYRAGALAGTHHQVYVLLNAAHQVVGEQISVPDGEELPRANYPHAPRAVQSAGRGKRSADWLLYRRPNPARQTGGDVIRMPRGLL